MVPVGRGIVVDMSVQCGQRNTDGTMCQRPVARRGAPCGATHVTASPAANPGAAAAVAAVPGPDPFAGSAPEPAGLTLGPPDKFGYQAVDIRGGVSDDAGRELIGRTVHVTLYTTGMFVKVKDVRDGTIIYDSMEQSPFPGIGGAELVERGVRFHDMMRLDVLEAE